MKSSELKQLIKEEVYKILDEITLKKAQDYILNKLTRKEDRVGDFYKKRAKEKAEEFLRFQDNLHEKDIYKYKTFMDLNRALINAYNTKSQKRIKVGKINPKDLNDPNLIYNQDKIRIYKATTKKDAIKYGCYTNMCISSRGTGDEDFWKLNTEHGEKFYFIFNDALESNNPKYTLTLRIDKSNIRKPYAIWLQDNNLEPAYEGQYSGLSNILPQLKNLQPIFDKN